MTQKSKKRNLTLEEKLEQALVPKEEQPYEIPDNWVWVKLNCVLSEIKNGTTINQNKSGNGYYVTRIESLQNQTVDFNRLGSIVDSNLIKESDWYKENDIILSHINSAEHVGKTALITSNMLPLVHGMNLLRLRFLNFCLSRYFQYFSQSFQYKDSIIKRINMAVNQVSINQKQLGNIQFPLPPLREQQHIITKIESLFEKLDRAKELAQSALDSFQTQKAAIFHQAFTGELTAKWRKENNINLESWESTNLGSKIQLISGQDVSSKLCNCEHLGIPYILGASNIIDNKFVVERWIENPKVISIKNDILLSVKGTIGKVYLQQEEKINISRQIMALRNNGAFDIKFLYYFILANSAIFGEKGTGLIPGIKRETVLNYKINIPLLFEQQEIVRILDNLFAKEQRIQELCNILDKIDLIKKSILAKAFRGELGTNDPTEESAIELLKQCLKDDE